MLEGFIRAFASRGLSRSVSNGAHSLARIHILLLKVPASAAACPLLEKLVTASICRVRYRDDGSIRHHVRIRRSEAVTSKQVLHAVCGAACVVTIRREEPGSEREWQALIGPIF